MIRKLRKSFICVLALLLSFTLFTACGKGESGNSTDKDTVLTVNMNSVLNNYAGDGQRACDNAKRVIDAGGAAATNEFVMGYELTQYLVTAMNKEGYSINYLNWGWGNNLINKQNSTLMSRSGCDVFIGESAWLASFARTGGLKPFPDDLAAFVRENCLPASYSAMEYNGKIYGINVETTPLVLIINKSLAKNIFGSSYQPPKTWSEWLSQMKTAKNRGVIPGCVTLEATDAGYIRNNVFFRQVGFDFGSEEAPDFNNAAIEYCLEFLNEMSDIHSGLNVNLGDYTTLQNAFVNGQSLFLVDSSAYYNQIIATGNYNVKDAYYVSLPVPDRIPGDDSYSPANVDSTSTPAGMITSCVYCVPAYVGEPKASAAFSFIRHYFDEEPQLTLRDSKTFCAMLKSVVDPAAPENKEFFEGDPDIASFYEMLNNDQASSTPVWAYDNAKSWAQVGVALTEARKTSPDFKTQLTSIQAQLELYYNKWKA